MAIAVWRKPVPGNQAGSLLTVRRRKTVRTRPRERREGKHTGGDDVDDVGARRSSLGELFYGFFCHEYHRIVALLDLIPV